MFSFFLQRPTPTKEQARAKQKVDLEKPNPSPTLDHFSRKTFMRIFPRSLELKYKMGPTFGDPSGVRKRSSRNLEANFSHDTGVL